MDGCTFCNISSHEIRAEILFENEVVMAFLDHRPISEGHSLVIPKKHFTDIFDVDADTLCEVYRVAKVTATAIDQVYHPSGINIIQNNGVNAGQTIFHFHVHVIPRYDSEYNKILGKIAATRKVVDHSELDPIRDIISNKMDQLM
jgi:histidine triad (HIT) family protein